MAIPFADQINNYHFEQKKIISSDSRRAFDNLIVKEEE
jgi:hypothetical protein